MTSLRHHNEGLVQSVADNFDFNIHSMNGLQQTHSLAMIFTQANAEEKYNAAETIQRFKVNDMRDEELPGPEIIPYIGPKKPEMPENEVKVNQLPNNIASNQTETVKINSEFDFSFLKQVVSEDEMPEYSGFNTKEVRESGRQLQKATSITYKPLIDAKPSDHSTILKAMKEAVKTTETTGQTHTI